MRPLIIVNNDPEIQRLSEELTTQNKIFEEKLKFIDKQRANAKAETIGKVWNNIEDYLVEKGLITEEKKKETQLGIQNGVLFEYSEEDNHGSLSSFLGGILTPTE